MDLSIAGFAQIDWQLYSEEPLIGPTFPSPRIANPTFLFPEHSPDGRWRMLTPEPILAPASGWRSSHIYALDVHRSPADGRFYLYFNARSHRHRVTVSNESDCCLARPKPHRCQPQRRARSSCDC